MIDESENTISFYGTLKQYEQIKIFTRTRQTAKTSFIRSKSNGYSKRCC